MAEDKRTELPAEDEVFLLRKEVVRLLKENSLLKDQLNGSGALPSTDAQQEPGEKRVGLEQRLQEIEKENMDFAKLYVEVQEQNEAITNLYVASHRLHATVDPGEVTKIILEILVELVGAEEFGVFLFDEKKATLHLMAGEGVEARLPSRSLPAGEGVIGEVASSGEPFYFEPQGSSGLESRLPLAAVPLNMNGTPVGVIVIYRLLSQKKRFSSIDHQLLHLLAVDAATALASARLHQSMARKLKTIEGFVQLTKS